MEVIGTPEFNDLEGCPNTPQFFRGVFSKEARETVPPQKNWMRK